MTPCVGLNSPDPKAMPSEAAYQKVRPSQKNGSSRALEVENGGNATLQ